MARLALVSCSNPPSHADVRLGLAAALADAGHELDASAMGELETAAWRWNPRERANALNRAFLDPTVDAIVDVSGGDLANEVLAHLDWESIAVHPTPMLGYSDLTCVLNAIAARTGQRAVLWNAEAGLHRGFGVLDAVLAGHAVRPDLIDGGHRDFIKSRRWLGGNLRCFLKLAGTPYWPDLTGSILLVESKGASLSSLASCLAQHSQMGTFRKIAGIVVGQLTAIDETGQRDAALSLIGEYVGSLPLAQTPGLGHSPDSQAATLG